jgi:hypothetical protein
VAFGRPRSLPALKLVCTSDYLPEAVPLRLRGVPLRRTPKTTPQRIAAECHNRTHTLRQIRGGYAVRSMRVSISLRSVPKSIGLVSSASAPFSKALRFVSALP